MWGRIAPVGLALAALAGVLVWLQASSPGGSDDASHRCSPAGDVRAPVSSHESGFHDAPFELRLEPRAGSGTLWYTTDGSWPDPERNTAATHAYEGPILVTDPTGSPLVLATLRTHIDPAALAEGREGSPTWDLADPGIDRATVIRARQAGAGECALVFFVGDHLRRHDLAVAHLSTDPAHLFDDATGIYVPGATFRRYLEGPDFDPRDGGWPFLPANYRERGREWERPAADDLQRSIVLHWFEPGGELGYLANTGLRIHGGATRSLPQKSLRLYARNDYGGRTFDHAFFGPEEGETFRRLILRNGGNDCVCANPLPGVPRTHMADDVLQAAMRDLRVETQASRPVAVFVDGEYWGLHQLRERYDEHHLALAHGVPDTAVTILDHVLAVQVGAEDDAQHFIGLLDLLRDADPDDPSTLASVEERMDLESFVDYMVAETFSGNGDWPQSNVELWRTRDAVPSTTGQGDGRWRWLLFDLDAAGNWTFDPTYDAFAGLLDIPDGDQLVRPTRFLFDRLMRIDAVRQQFLERYDELLDTVLAPARTIAVLEEMAATVATEMDQQRRRWFAGISDEQWAREHGYDSLRSFLDRRPDEVREQLRTHFGG